MFDSLEALDRALFLKLNSFHGPVLDLIMWQLSESWHTYLLVAIVAFVFYRKFSAKKCLEFLVGIGIVLACTDMTSNTIKHGVKRLRPTHNTEIKEKVHVVNNYRGGQYAFFSAHAANGFGAVTFIFFCLKWMRPLYRWSLFIYPLLIVYSRMYLGVHYPSDIIAGILVGIFFGSIVFLIINKYFLKLDAQLAA